MPTLIEQLNATRRRRDTVREEGRRRLRALQVNRDSGTLEREQRQAELDDLRESRTVNPRSTANNAARLLEGDGGFGAAILFGITSAQADFADSVDARIEDARQGLQELRQRDLDQQQTDQIAFNQQVALNQQELEGAQLEVSEAQSDIERADRLLQQDTVNQRADRQLDLQSAQLQEQRRSTQFQESRQREQDATARVDRQLDISESIAGIQAQIRNLNPEASEEDQELERQALEATAEALGEAEAQFVFRNIFGESSDPVRGRAAVAKTLIDNSDEFVQSIRSFKTQEAKQEFLDTLTGSIDPNIQQTNELVERVLARDPKDSNGTAKRLREQANAISLLRARVTDEVNSGNENAREIQLLRDREALLNTALRATIQSTQQQEQ